VGLGGPQQSGAILVIRIEGEDLTCRTGRRVPIVEVSGRFSLIEKPVDSTLDALAWHGRMITPVR
jgi:hypothetical protein